MAEVMTDRHDIVERLEECAATYYGAHDLARDAAALIREYNQQNCVAEVIAASVIEAFTSEIERRHALEFALRTVLARITNTIAESWRCTDAAPYPGTLAEFIRATIEGAGNG